MNHRQARPHEWMALEFAHDQRSQKWLVTCVTCGRVGLRANAPEKFWNWQRLEQIGRMELDGAGRCLSCSAAAADRSAT
jgi:hypothetical protein